jgi:hypothetical protein
MANESLIPLLDTIITSAQTVRAALSAPAPPPPPIATPDAFDRALAAAAPGDILMLDATFAYPKALTLTTPIMIRPAVDIPSGRMTADVPLPVFAGGVTVAGDDVTLLGCEIRHTSPLYAVLTLHGARTMVERCRVLGDQTVGSRRAIEANHNGNCTIRQNYIDSGPGQYPSATGGDYQAICAWNMAPGLFIEDNTIIGAGETIMFGGADSPSEDRMPADITIRGNTITAKPEWMAMPVQKKNILELKAAVRVLIEHNDMSQSWGGHGQDGYAFLCTVRNQSGKAPWSTVSDVIFQDNTVHDCAAAINILALDNHFPTVRAARIKILRNHFFNMDPAKFTAVSTQKGSQKMIQVDSGPDQLTIDSNVFEGVGLTSVVLFPGDDNKAKATSFILTNNRWPKTPYRIFGTGMAVGPQAWQTFTDANSVEGGNVEI